MTRIIALGVYDLILSSPMEVRRIWKRRLGAGTILYISIRYGAILSRFFDTGVAVIVPRNLIVSITEQYKVWILRSSMVFRGEYQKHCTEKHLNFKVAVKRSQYCLYFLRFTLRLRLQASHPSPSLNNFWQSFSIWLCPCMGCLWPPVVTYIHSICSEHVYPCDEYCKLRDPQTFMTLILLAVWEHSPIDSRLCSGAIRPFGRMSSLLWLQSISIVSIYCYKHTITNIMFSCLCMPFPSHMCTDDMLLLVGVITRAVSVAADAAVLVVTLQKTFHIFKMDGDVRSSSKVMSTLAYNGKPFV